MANASNKSQAAEWAAKNARRRFSLIFETDAQRDAWEAQAEKEGYKRFSRWLIDKVKLGAEGRLMDPGTVENLETQIDQLHASVEYERGMANDYRGQVAELTAEIQDYARKFAELAARGKP